METLFALLVIAIVAFPIYVLAKLAQLARRVTQLENRHSPPS